MHYESTISLDLFSFPRPQLLVVVDTEEEFDWSAPFRREANTVQAMGELYRFQSLCEEFGIRPCYVADYPVLTQPQGYEPLRNWQSRGTCEVGVHLHPWVNPPFLEEVNARNSYAGNLPREWERTKLQELCSAYRRNIGGPPTIYKAGRYGLGPSTYEMLTEMGFQADFSPCPPFDFRADGGPDYRTHPVQPFVRRLPQSNLLVCPTTGGYTGMLGRRAAGLEFWARKLPRGAGVLSHLNIVQRVRLSPEGFGFEECRALTERLIAEGVTVFSYSLHSPSMMPGCTPYVRSAAELRPFLESMRRYFDYFLHTLHGEATSPGELVRAVQSQAVGA